MVIDRPLYVQCALRAGRLLRHDGAIPQEDYT
jgi:hypothetical protein